MKSTALILSSDVNRAPDLVHRVRRLGFFKQHISQATWSIAGKAQVPATFDQQRAAVVFLSWIEDVNAQKSYSQINRRDYIAFSAGMLLRSLLANHAIHISPVDHQPAVSIDPAAIWPQGFIATSYCLSVLDAVMDQEHLQQFDLSPVWQDVSMWQSFRENVLEMPSLAIPFLDLLIGNEPNWDYPTWARSRRAMMTVRQLN